MRKGILIILAVMAIGLIGTTISEAGIYAAGYPNGDELVIYSASSWDNWNHLVITYNNSEFSASATVLDPNGIPSTDYGFYYYWAEFYTTYFDFWGSNDGSQWTKIGSYYY